jgi:hypothetical protein
LIDYLLALEPESLYCIVAVAVAAVFIVFVVVADVIKPSNLTAIVQSGCNGEHALV